MDQRVGSVCTSCFWGKVDPESIDSKLSSFQISYVVETYDRVSLSNTPFHQSRSLPIDVSNLAQEKRSDTGEAPDCPF